MIRGLAVIGTVVAACCLSSGCSITQTGGCGPGGCGPGVTACGGCDTCGPPVADCSCGHCSACLGHSGDLLGPIRQVGHRAHNALTCGAGCGEIYWGEWISDPPDACDPCDCDGHWTGARCDRIPLLDRLHFLWNGYRYHGDCEPGCTSCDGPGPGELIPAHSGRWQSHSGPWQAGGVPHGAGQSYIVEEGTYLPEDGAYSEDGGFVVEQPTSGRATYRRATPGRATSGRAISGPSSRAASYRSRPAGSQSAPGPQRRPAAAAPRRPSLSYRAHQAY